MYNADDIIVAKVKAGKQSCDTTLYSSIAQLHLNAGGIGNMRCIEHTYLGFLTFNMHSDNPITMSIAR